MENNNLRFLECFCGYQIKKIASKKKQDVKVFFIFPFPNTKFENNRSANEKICSPVHNPITPAGNIWSHYMTFIVITEK